tara:strand:- start:647 stop:1012 length:366 start_codon:yes stop_codon:yes gene_type:complete
MNDSVFHHVRIIYKDGGKLCYVVKDEQSYFSKRYGKWVTCHDGMQSDGATGALDIDSFSWLFHDKLCDTGLFDDGTKCTNWQASQIISDILKSEGYWFRSKTWLWSTFAFGGGKARDNGMY